MGGVVICDGGMAACMLFIATLPHTAGHFSYVTHEKGFYQQNSWRDELVQRDDSYLGQDVDLQKFTRYFSLALVFM